MDSSFILITGATSSIGAMVARTLSKSYNLIVSGRDEDNLLTVASELDGDKRCLTWVCDLADVSKVRSSLQEFIELNNIRIAGFVHVAGVVDILPIRLSQLKNMQQTFNVNFFSTAEIIPVLLKKRNKEFFKNILFISSTYSNFGGKGQTVYSASKAAIEGYARGCAVELAPNIRVNVVSPGAVENNKANSYPTEYLEKLKQAHPLGFGTPDDVAYMVEFLLSDKASWITGQTFIVDGGYSINSVKG